MCQRCWTFVRRRERFTSKAFVNYYQGQKQGQAWNAPIRIHEKRNKDIQYH